MQSPYVCISIFASLLAFSARPTKPAQMERTASETKVVLMQVAPSTVSSSIDQPGSSTLFTGAPGTVTSGYLRAAGAIQIQAEPHPRNRPFRSLGLTAKLGTGGIGFDVGTPVAPRLGLRAGAQFYNQGFGFTTDGLNSQASLHLQNVGLMLDVFPFRNGFHLSPGIALSNENSLAGVVTVAGGQRFTLGSTNFVSSVTDPVRGTATIQIGNKVAPRFTLGWDHVLRNKAGHFSFPVEFGFQYSAAPVVTLNLSGTACYQQGCAKMSSYGVSSAAQQEVLQLQHDLRPLRFYPITSTGIRYTFER